jgi:hypothetical protein
MRSLFHFIVTPKGNRTTNQIKINDKELIVNTELQNHQYVNRIGIVLNTPKNEKTDIKKGDEVILHHNVFRRFYDVRGKETNSKSYFNEDTYFVDSSQIFLYKRNGEWYAPKNYCFVKPIQSNNIFSTDFETPLTGVVKYLDKSLAKNGIKKDDLVGFTPRSEYEFIIEGERLYRVTTDSIAIKYGYKGNEKEYNPSWT